MRTLVLFLIAAFLVAPGKSTADQSSGGGAVSAGTGTPSASAAATGNTLKGSVIERIDASPYSYLRIRTAAGEAWAAVPPASVEKGAQVTVYSAMPMENFESKTIKRKFALVYFGTLSAADQSAHAPAAAAGPGPHALAGKGSVEVKKGTIAKATGSDARTVAEVWAQQAALSEKTVTVRGKVVKFNGGIMGRNWVHLQDGTGDPAKGTHDITVTTQAKVAQGEVTMLKGVVRLNKDFGAGYSYALIVEDAKIQR